MYVSQHVTWLRDDPSCFDITTSDGRIESRYFGTYEGKRFRCYLRAVLVGTDGLLASLRPVNVNAGHDATYTSAGICETSQ